MKLFKWYLIDDIDKMCFTNGMVKELKQRLDISEQKNWEQYLKIKQLEELLDYYRNHQKIEIVNLESKGE